MHKHFYDSNSFETFLACPTNDKDEKAHGLAGDETLCGPDGLCDEDDVWDDPVIKELLDLLRKHLPDVTYLRRNPERLDRALRTADDLFGMMKESDPDAVMEVSPDPLLGTDLMVVIKTDWFGACGKEEIVRFSDAIGAADAFEILALTDGRADIGLTFQGCFSIVGARYDRPGHGE